jgi:cytidylate kinase
MAKLKKLIIACDGESASGKSTAAKLVSKKYKLLLINSGLLYRYCSKLIINEKPKNIIPFLKNKFKTISYKVYCKTKASFRGNL